MTINVALGGSVPRLLRNIIKTLAGEEKDITISIESISTAESYCWIGENAVDVMIVGYDTSTGEHPCVDLFNQMGRTSVIAVAKDDCEAVMCSLKPVSKYLGQLSPESLIEAIRDSRKDLQPHRTSPFMLNGKKTTTD